MPLKGSREGHPGYFEAMGQSSGRFSGALHGLLHKAASKSGLDPYIDEHVIRRMEWIANASQGTQVLLRMLYRDRVERHLPLPSFDDVEFRVHSQNGEDGILLYLFSILEAPTKRSVEICAGEGFECNTANLIINHGWRGLLVDGDEAKVQRAKDFYAPNRSTSWFPPHVAHAWVTAENVDKYLRGYGFDGEIDLLSLDLDGIDYWIWKAMESVSPRVVVAEYNWTWGPTESKTVPYKAHFTNPPRDDASKSENMYFGASLAALTKLARTKGLRLVGAQRWGFNAFFVREGVGEELLPEISPAECFDTPVMRTVWSPSLLEELAAQEWVSV
jgi:hypothetical protein